MPNDHDRYADESRRITERLDRDDEREPAINHRRRQLIPLVREGTLRTLIEKGGRP
jgi:hypothetical protein